MTWLLAFLATCLVHIIWLILFLTIKKIISLLNKFKKYCDEDKENRSFWDAIFTISFFVFVFIFTFLNIHSSITIGTTK